jgi:hypothetical protein
VEDRISHFEDKRDEIEISDEYIENRMKKYEQNMQQICNSVKQSNLWIMDVEEEEVKVKGIGNIFNKEIAEN